MKVRKATLQDKAAFLALAEQFVRESGYGWTFSLPIAAHTFHQILDSEEHEIFVAEEGDDIGAGIIVAHDRDYCLERLGYVVKFYVSPGFRGTTAGRELVVAADIWFIQHDVWAAFVTSTANIGAAQGRQFENLFAKFRFIPCGPTMLKDYRQ